MRAKLFSRWACLLDEPVRRRRRRERQPSTGHRRCPRSGFMRCCALMEFGLSLLRRRCPHGPHHRPGERQGNPHRPHPRRPTQLRRSLQRPRTQRHDAEPVTTTGETYTPTGAIAWATSFIRVQYTRAKIFKKPCARHAYLSFITHVPRLYL